MRLNWNCHETELFPLTMKKRWKKNKGGDRWLEMQEITISTHMPVTSQSCDCSSTQNQSHTIHMTAAVHKTITCPQQYTKSVTWQSHDCSSEQISHMTVIWPLQYSKSHDSHMTLLQYKEVTWQWCDCCSTMRKSHDSHMTAAVQWWSHMTVTQLPQYN